MMARDRERRGRVRRMLARAPWWRRLEARVVLSLMLLASLCVGAAYYLVSTTAAYYEERGQEQERIADRALATARPFYDAVVVAKREAFTAKTELWASTLPPADAEADVRHAALEGVLQGDASVLSLRRGDVTVDRMALEAGDVDDDVIEVEMRAGQGGEELVAVFGVDRTLDRNYQALAEYERDLELEALEDGTVAERSEVDRAIARLIASASALVLLGSFVAGFILARQTTRKLSDISDVMRRVAAGDPLARAPELGPDELGLLASDLNAMLDRLERAQNKLAYLQRIGAWQDMARRIAHEIKNPLTPIQLAVQQLREKDPGTDERFSRLLSDSVEIIEDEIEGLRRMVTSFSQFAKVPEVVLEPVDLRRLVAEFERAYGHLSERTDDRLEVDVDDTFDGEAVHRVRADRQLLKQVLVNLVENANLSARERGEQPVVVRVGLRATKAGAEIVVEDNGPGVPDARRERVFEPYETTRAHGTGLGLAIVKKVVLDHGGEIWVGHSERLGGAAFTLRIPLEQVSE